MKILRYKSFCEKKRTEPTQRSRLRCPDAFGRTVEEALEMAKEAIDGFIACMIARGEEVPVETDDSRINGIIPG